MTLDLSNWLPHILLLGSIAFVIGVVQLWLYLERRKGRRNPFTKDFLRSPGESLQAELDDIRYDILGNFFLILFIPVLLMAAYFGTQINGAGHASLSIFVFLGISVVIYSLDACPQAQAYRATQELNGQASDRPETAGTHDVVREEI